MIGLVVLFAAVVAIHGQTTNVSPCSWDPADLPINAYIQGCDNPPCLLPQGQDAIVDLIFKAPRNIQTMTTLARAMVSPIPIPISYNLRERAQTCNFLSNSFCPVLKGEILRYVLHMPILDIFPVGVVPTVEFRITDENNTPFICVRAVLQITEGNASRQGNSTLTAQ